MPNLLRRLTRISFRSEMLIINLLGLVNSTLDWVPLKWSTEVESVGNLPLTKESFAFNTISADRIRSILTWIVLAKVLVDNLYTVSYLSNLYSVITWSRPLLLIPWILFSFFKNFILEVLIFAIGTLLAFEERLPLLLLLEFVIVKVVQFNLASYTWYRNTRLYLFLKCRDRLLQLRKGVRSLSIPMNGFNYSSRPRSRSLATIMSYDGSNANGFSKSNSRIYAAPDLTPREKAMKILNLSEQDIREAKNKRQQQLPDKPRISSAHMDVPSTEVSSGLPHSNEQQCSSLMPSTNRGLKHIENKTASFYFLKTPLDLPLDVSNMPLWSERVHPSTGEQQEAEKSVEIVKSPEQEIKEDSMAGTSKEGSHSRTTTASLVGKPDILAQEPTCKLSIAHMDNVPSSNEVTLSSAEIVEKPCTSIMKRKEQKSCLAKSGIGECPIGKCTISQKNSQTISKNVVQDNNNAATDMACYKEPDNVDEKVDPSNRQRSDELKAIDSSMFFDANDESFTVDKGEHDAESLNSLRIKRKLCSDKGLKCEEPRKIQKVEECSSTPSPENVTAVRTNEDNINGGKTQMSNNNKCQDVVVTASAHSTISEGKPSDSSTGEDLVEDIVITQNVANDFENALITRKPRDAKLIRSEESEQSKTKLQNLRSPKMKPRKTYYSQQKNRPPFYTSPKRQARETENRSEVLRICRKRLPRDTNALDKFKNNVGSAFPSGTNNDRTSSTSITIQPDMQKKDAGALKPRSENTGPLPLTETTRPLNYSNVTIRNPLTPASVRSSHSINSIAELTKDKESIDETKKLLASVTGVHSSAGRAARFKQVKALRGYNEISVGENRRDSMLCQRENLSETGSVTESRDPGFHDHWDKENIHSHALFKEPAKPMHSISYTGTTNIILHKPQNVILLNSQGLDDIIRPSNTWKGTEDSPEAEVRRRLTRFSASKEEEGESSISAVCSKKIEGQQEGKDLVRILAKEDVRNVVASGTSASTSRDPPIESSHYQTLLINKFESNESSAVSVYSSSMVDSVAIESEEDQKDTSASIAESVQVNSSNGEMETTITTLTEDPKPTSFDDGACYSSTIHEMQDRVNDMMQTLDRLEKKMDVSGYIKHVASKVKIPKNENSDEATQIAPSIDTSITNSSQEGTFKSEEIGAKEKLGGSQIDDSLQTSPTVIDKVEDTHQKNEELDNAVSVDTKSDREIDVKKIDSSQILNESENDNGSLQSAVQLEKVLGTVEYNNADLLHTKLKEEEMQAEILKNDHLVTCDKPLDVSTKEVKNEGEYEVLPTIAISLDVIPESLPKSSEFPAIERLDGGVTDTETAPIDVIPESLPKSSEFPAIERLDGGVTDTETAPIDVIPESLPKYEFPAIKRLDEGVTDTETAPIPPNEEQEECIAVVDTSNVHQQRRLPMTTIVLFFILAINFYMSYFYRNVLKPIFIYTVLSMFLAIFSLVVRLRTSRSVPPAEDLEIEEAVELFENEGENILEMKSDLLPIEGKSDVEDAADTERALSSLPQKQEPIGTDNEPACSPNTEETTDKKDVAHSETFDEHLAIDLKMLSNPTFQQYRVAGEDESDIEDSFRASKTFNSLSKISILLSDSVKMNQSDPHGQEAATQMADRMKDFHLSDSEASTGTIQSTSGEDAVSLGQGSSLEEFPQDSTPEAESQV